MPFFTGSLLDHQKSSAGEIYDATLVETASTFEDGLKVGLFAKMDGGSLDNVDGSASPVIAGVVKRNPANPVEDGGAYDASLITAVDFAVSNYVTVQAVSGETPSYGDAIFCENSTSADYGKATTTSTSNADASAVFVKVVDSANDVWQIRLK